MQRRNVLAIIVTKSYSQKIWSNTKHHSCIYLMWRVLGIHIINFLILTTRNGVHSRNTTLNKIFGSNHQTQEEPVTSKNQYKQLEKPKISTVIQNETPPEDNTSLDFLKKTYLQYGFQITNAFLEILALAKKESVDLQIMPEKLVKTGPFADLFVQVTLLF